MKFRYIGEEAVPGSGETIVFGDVKVQVGGVFECPEQFVARAKSNRFFEAVTQDEAPAPERDEKSELIAIAESYGVKIDKRWNAAKIQAAIEAKAKADGMVFDVTRHLSQESN